MRPAAGGPVEASPTLELGPRAAPSAYSIDAPHRWVPIGTQGGRLLVLEEEPSRAALTGLLEVDLETGLQVALRDQTSLRSGNRPSALLPAVGSGPNPRVWYPPTLDEVLAGSDRADDLRNVQAVAL